MKVKYIGEEVLGNFTLGEIYCVVDALEVCGETFYLTSNHKREKWYFKSKLFEVVEE